MFVKSTNTFSDLSLQSSANVASDLSFSQGGDSSDLSFNSSANLFTDRSFSPVSGFQKRSFERPQDGGWSGDNMTGDYFAFDELLDGTQFGQGMFGGIRHFNK